MNSRATKIFDTSLIEKGFLGKKISFYNCHESIVPESLLNNANLSIKMENGRELYSISDDDADVYFINKEATRVLLARFPIYSNYVFMNTRPSLSWVIAIPGLIRRLLRKSVKLRGTAKFQSEKKESRWLVIENLKKIPRPVKHAKSSLSLEIGVTGFLKFLKEEKIKYVALRFFDKLPELHRDGGDLDILVEDEHVDKVENFLAKNPGPILIEIKASSKIGGNGIPYYVPHLARTILDSAIEGPAGSLVPSPREAFLSFAYHILYHKGLEAGVPTKIEDLESSKNPDNDYLGELIRLANKANLKAPLLTMEDIEEYLYEEGWRPKLDTLAKIALENKWVRKRLSYNESKEDLSLGVMILKEGIFKRDLLEPIVKSISNKDGFIIVRKKRFLEEKRFVADHLRGGVWTDETNNKEDYSPSMAIVVFDLYGAKSIKANVADTESGKRIKILKDKLRKELNLDKNSTNFIHSTDNTSEAWEYIEICFRGEVDKIREEIHQIHQNAKLPLIKRLLILTKFKVYYFFKYSLYSIKRKEQYLRSFLVKLIIR